MSRKATDEYFFYDENNILEEKTKYNKNEKITRAASLHG